jgi:hypothetical protein
MIKVTISDMQNTKDVFSVPELREILATRYGNDANSFEIVPFGKHVPHLTIVVKQNLSVLNYFDSTDTAGFVSDNPDNNLDQNGFTTFYYQSPISGEEYWNRQIVSASDAMRAAEEFAVTIALPTAVRWVEL